MSGRYGLPAPDGPTSVFSPVRHYMTILQSILLKGADLTTLWPKALALLALGIGMAYLSTRNVERAFE